jgi:RND family efflux transporter MFP subunit
MNTLTCRLSLACSVLALTCGAIHADEVEVSVARPVVREVIDYLEAGGRIDAMARVELRARVTGYLVRTNCKDGARVKKGDVLFEIDSRPYQALLAKAQADVAFAEARLKRTEAELERFKRLLPLKAISEEDIKKANADREEAQALVAVARASTDVAKLNVDLTRVLSPLDGRVSRHQIDPGNLVVADQTTLTTVISEGPVYVSFDVDESSYLQLMNLRRERKAKEKPQVPVAVALASDEGFPRQAVVDTAEGEVDSKTGTIRIRALLPNDDETMRPGQFARVRLALGEPTKGVLVSERAIGTDGNIRFVYTVDGVGVVRYRRVRLGSLAGGLRIVRSGLKSDEQVVVGGLYKVRPGLVVKVKSIEMPEKAPE